MLLQRLKISGGAYRGFVSGGLFLILAIVVLAASSVRSQEEEQLTRQTKENELDIADTIKYLEKLEKLDKYWSEVARPRFGRSQYKQQAAFNGMHQRPGNKQLQDQRYGSLMELINARLAQKYNSNAAY